MHKHNISGDAAVVRHWNRISEELDSREREWISTLRADGVVAAHPDDGWVDREKNTVIFTYPQFDDGAAVGSLVALGWPSKYRLVRLIGFRKGPFIGQWVYAPINPPPSRLWSRVVSYVKRLLS